MPCTRGGAQGCLARTHKVDVLAEGTDAEYWAFLFEITNRQEKHRPTMAEAELFVANVASIKQWLKQPGKNLSFICPVYLGVQTDTIPGSWNAHGDAPTSFKCNEGVQTDTSPGRDILRKITTDH